MNQNPVGERAVQQVVPQWRTTRTLELLQQLVDDAAMVPSAVAASAGLSTSELHSLRHLMNGPVGPVDLARYLAVTSAASSGVVDRLVGRGLAERTPHPSDGRRTTVAITESGRRELMRHLAPMFAGLATVDDDLSEGDRVVVERYLTGVIQAMNRVR